jgi:hypothetical protein
LLKPNQSRFKYTTEHDDCLNELAENFQNVHNLDPTEFTRPIGKLIKEAFNLKFQAQRTWKEPSKHYQILYRSNKGFSQEEGEIVQKLLKERTSESQIAKILNRPDGRIKTYIYRYFPKQQKRQDDDLAFILFWDSLIDSDEKSFLCTFDDQHPQKSIDVFQAAEINFGQ